MILTIIQILAIGTTKAEKLVKENHWQHTDKGSVNWRYCENSECQTNLKVFQDYYTGRI